MFTGIIEHVGKVAEVTPTATGRRLLVDPCGWTYASKAAVGDSVAIGGCCLTLAAAPSTTGGLMAFDAIPETLSKTNLGELTPGRNVNLEHAATLGTLLGGHVVQGHIDGVGSVEKNEKRRTPHSGGEDSWGLRVGLSRDLMKWMVPKGSIALDGVSLTLAAVDVPGSAIEIALIPTTLAKTTLGNLKPGDSINVEADVMAKAVVHYLEHFAGAGVSGGTRT